MDAASDRTDIAKTYENRSVFNDFGGLECDPGSSEELWVELLAHWMAEGWLAGGLAGGGLCWLGDRLATGTP